MSLLIEMAPQDTDRVYGAWCFSMVTIASCSGLVKDGAWDLIQDTYGDAAEDYLEWIRSPESETSSIMSRTDPPSVCSVTTQTTRPPTSSTATDPPSVCSVTTQTTRPPTPSTATDPPPTPLTRTYAEIAVQAAPPKERRASPKPTQGQSRKGKEGARQSPVPPKTPPRPPARARSLPAPLATEKSLPTTRAFVMHAAPLKYKPGTMRRWIEEDNKGLRILGIRWLLKEDRRGQLASSLVIYMKDPVGCGTKLRMGRRLFRTTCYDWDR